MPTLESTLAFTCGFFIVYLMFKCMRIFLVVGLLCLGLSSSQAAVQFINCTTNMIYIAAGGVTWHVWLPVGGVQVQEPPSGGIGNSMVEWWMTPTRVFLTSTSNVLSDGQSYVYSGSVSGVNVDVTPFYPFTNSSPAVWITNIDMNYQTNVDENLNTNIYYYYTTNITSSNGGGITSVTNALSVASDSSNTDNVMPSFSYGFGFGLTICGFGWILGMAKKVSDF